MQYVDTATVTGSPDTAFAILRDALIANGFTIVDAKPTGFSVQGPGMTSSNQNPILGVSQATFCAHPGAVHVQAELGGVVRLRRFATCFPLALGLLMAATFTLIFWLPDRRAPRLLVATIPLLATAPWLILGPTIGIHLRKRTEKALHALLQSAAQVSRLGPDARR